MEILMKIKYSIRRQVPLQPDILEEKINLYLKKNFYRITDKGSGYVIFIDDEYSDRKRLRSDYHTRIGEGKFEFHSTGQETTVRLIYFTSVIYPILLMIIFAAMSVYINSSVPFLCSFVLSLPTIHKIYYLNEHVFNEILES